MRTLARSVIVTDRETRQTLFLRKGEQVSAEVAGLISNPRAFADEPDDVEDAEPAREPAAPAPAAPAGDGPLEDQQPLTDEQVTEVLSHSVDDVNALLDLAPEHAAQVLAAETAGKDRKGIVEGPHAAPPADQ